MTMIDSGKKDHKIIAVATKDPEFNSYHEFSEMPPIAWPCCGASSRITSNWRARRWKSMNWSPPARLIPIIEDALQRYSEQRRKGFYKGH